MLKYQKQQGFKSYRNTKRFVFTTKNVNVFKFEKKSIVLFISVQIIKHVFLNIIKFRNIKDLKYFCSYLIVKRQLRISLLLN